MVQCALKFKANKLGVVPDGNALVFNSIAPGTSGYASVGLNCVAAQFSADPFSDKVTTRVTVVYLDRCGGTVVINCIALSLLGVMLRRVMAAVVTWVTH